MKSLLIEPAVHARDQVEVEKVSVGVARMALNRHF